MNTNTVNCPACTAPIALTLNHPQCVNNPTASIIILTHERGIDCAACGAYFVLAIAQCNLDFMLMAAERPVDAGLIIPSRSKLHVV